MPPRFLRYWLNAIDWMPYVGGTTRAKLTQAGMSQVTIPLPPVTEQRQIVAKLDSLAGRTARARDDLERIPHDTAFFVPRPLSAAVRSTFYGPRIAKEANVSSGIPTLRTTDIGEWGRLCPQNPPQVNVGQQERSKWEFLDGDLMVTRTGATIGKCAVYEERLGPALPSAYLIRVRLDMQIAVPRFVLLFLLSPKGQQQLLPTALGTDRRPISYGN
jgi:type I restriction enzyme, S subunit